ncbi:hypothetical protein AUC47_00040 [Microbacterium sp. SZ1]|uniref:hypothetical protein n=1 Tax=Microbacterium sp. SZ1 TaxID=1849736 RepID=UPI000BBC1ACB|nr:hypothetical protein [Microbacterium sp. SZ1]PCE16284.1 hypothetical protein AUC47_00040 [Microbacterium sp. SZ1]
MTSTHRRRRGALALAALAGALLLGSPLVAPSALAASAPESGGAVEVSYSDASEIRPGEGWLIDCSGVGALEGITVTCAEDRVELVSAGFDTDLGTQTLTVPQVFGATRLSVDYRVRLEPPPAPEVGVDRLDLPIAVGEQALIPLSALAITCAVCTDDGGATIRVDDPPAGLSAGVSSTHLALRTTTPGDAVVPITVTDDAGQAVSIELTVSVIAAPDPTIGGLHVVGDATAIPVVDQIWGGDAAIVCSAPQSIGLRCTPDGGVERTGTGPSQLLFRVVADDGRFTWGSITDDPDADDIALAAPSWESEAPLSLVSAPVDEQQADDVVPLAGLAQLLEGIPAS